MLTQNEKTYGAAFDLGTTTLVGYFFELNTGTCLFTKDCLNPQTEFGSDVISRITFFSASEDNAGRLCESLGNAVSDMTHLFFAECGITGLLSELVLVGNPIIMGSIAKYSFDDISTNVLRVPAIGDYVGADALAASMMVERERKGRDAFLIDIGTNSEIVYLSDKFKMATSAAAGPALEGGNISCGMRCTDGAIDRIELTKEVSGNPDIIFHVKGEITPEGICGSGLMQLLMILLDTGTINNDGYLLSKQEALQQNVPVKIAGRIFESKTPVERINRNKNNRFFKLTDSISVSQDDIRNLQLAISAIKSGIEILISKKILTQEVNEKPILFFFAGAFGNNLTEEIIKRCGLVPKNINCEIVQSGNLAGIGACEILLKNNEISDVIKLKNSISTLALTEVDSFQNTFIDNMQF